MSNCKIDSPEKGKPPESTVDSGGKTFKYKGMDEKSSSEDTAESTQQNIAEATHEKYMLDKPPGDSIKEPRSEGANCNSSPQDHSAFESKECTMASNLEFLDVSHSNKCTSNGASKDNSKLDIDKQVCDELSHTLSRNNSGTNYQDNLDKNSVKSSTSDEAVEMNKDVLHDKICDADVSCQSSVRENSNKTGAINISQKAAENKIQEHHTKDIHVDPKSPCTRDHEENTSNILGNIAETGCKPKENSSIDLISDTSEVNISGFVEKSSIEFEVCLPKELLTDQKIVSASTESSSHAESHRSEKSNGYDPRNLTEEHPKSDSLKGPEVLNLGTSKWSQMAANHSGNQEKCSHSSKFDKNALSESISVKGKLVSLQDNFRNRKAASGLLIGEMGLICGPNNFHQKLVGNVSHTDSEKDNLAKDNSLQGDYIQTHVHSMLDVNGKQTSNHDPLARTFLSEKTKGHALLFGNNKKHGVLSYEENQQETASNEHSVCGCFNPICNNCSQNYLSSKERAGCSESRNSEGSYVFGQAATASLQLEHPQFSYDSENPLKSKTSESNVQRNAVPALSIRGTGNEGRDKNCPIERGNIEVHSQNLAEGKIQYDETFNPEDMLIPSSAKLAASLINLKSPLNPIEGRLTDVDGVVALNIEPVNMTEQSAQNMSLPHPVPGTSVNVKPAEPRTSHLVSKKKHAERLRKEECLKLKKSLKSVERFKAHHALGLKCSECDICVKGFTTTSLMLRHITLIPGIVLSNCMLCIKGHADEDMLRRHLQKHVNHTCRICSKVVNAETVMKTHKKVHKKRGESNRAAFLSKIAENGNKDRNKDLQTKIIKRLSAGEKLIKYVLEKMHTGAEDLKTETLTDEDATVNAIEEGQKVSGTPYPEQQNKQTIRKFSFPMMRNKLSSATGSNPSNAAHKRKPSPLHGYNFKYAKTRDYSNLHKMFSFKQYTKGTRKTGSGPHICHICNGSFKRLDYLTQHMAYHTGYKPFKCSDCEQGFFRPGQLVTHFIKSHDHSEDSIPKLYFDKEKGHVTVTLTNREEMQTKGLSYRSTSRNPVPQIDIEMKTSGTNSSGADDQEHKKTPITPVAPAKELHDACILCGEDIVERPHTCGQGRSKNHSETEKQSFCDVSAKEAAENVAANAQKNVHTKNELGSNGASESVQDGKNEGSSEKIEDLSTQSADAYSNHLPEIYEGHGSPSSETTISTGLEADAEMCLEEEEEEEVNAGLEFDGNKTSGTVTMNDSKAESNNGINANISRYPGAYSKKDPGDGTCKAPFAYRYSDLDDDSNKASGDDCNKGSGNDSDKGSGNDSNKVSGSDSNKGSGNDSNKGSGDDNDEGSGDDSDKGSGYTINKLFGENNKDSGDDTKKGSEDDIDKVTEFESRQGSKPKELYHSDVTEKIHRCNFCGKEYPTYKQLLTHQVIHNTYRPTCRTCGKLFLNEDALKRHQETHKNEKAPSDRNFSIDEMLKSPPTEVPSRDPDRLSLENVLNGPVITNVRSLECPLDMRVSHQSPVCCIMCSQVYDTREKYEKHQCMQFVSGSSAFTHLMRGENNLNAAPVFKHSSGEKSIANRNRSNIAGEETERNSRHPSSASYSCPKCFLVFNNVHEFTAHVNEHFTSPKNTFTSDYYNEPSTKVEPLFNCPHCELNFSSVGKLVLHKNAAHPPDSQDLGRYQCPYCLKRFKNSGHFKEHMRLHTGEKPYVCSFCFRAFAQSSGLRAHIRSHAGVKQYVCLRCGKSYDKEQELSEHKQEHKIEDCPYRCGTCNLAFSSDIELQRHFYSLHAYEQAPIETSPPLVEKERLSTASPKNVCMIEPIEGFSETNADSSNSQPAAFESTDENFPQDFTKTPEIDSDPFVKGSPGPELERSKSGDGRKSSFTDSGDILVTPTPNLLSREETPHLMPREETPHPMPREGYLTENEGMSTQCILCKDSFPTFQQLESHWEIMHPIEYYSSKFADSHFKMAQYPKPSMQHPVMKRSLKDPPSDTMSATDMSSTSKMKGLYSCSQCSVKYDSLAELEAHQIEHGVKKNYACEVCEKVFTRPKSLRLHKEMHCKGGELEAPGTKGSEDAEESMAKYGCLDCPQEFVNYLDLLFHAQVHGTIKIFRCIRCGESFSNNEDFRNHNKTHTHDKKLRCSKCQNEYDTPVMLNLHLCDDTEVFPPPPTMDSDGRIRQFACCLCDAKFIFKNHMFDHFILHTPIRSHNCTICGRGFMRPAALRKHVGHHMRVRRKMLSSCNVVPRTTPISQILPEDEAGTIAMVSELDKQRNVYRGSNEDTQDYVFESSQQNHISKGSDLLDGDMGSYQQIQGFANTSSEYAFTPGKREKRKRSRKKQNMLKECEECGVMLKNDDQYMLHKKHHHKLGSSLISEFGLGSFSAASLLDGKSDGTNSAPETDSQAPYTSTQNYYPSKPVFPGLDDDFNSNQALFQNDSSQNDNSFQVQNSFTISSISAADWPETDYGDVSNTAPLQIKTEPGLELQDSLDDEEANQSSILSDNKEGSHENTDDQQVEILEEVYTCNLCDETFDSARSLRFHIRIHNQPRSELYDRQKHTCQYCEKNFRTSQSLRLHLMIHTGETPHECELCEEKFRLKKTLELHLAKFHNMKNKPRKRRSSKTKLMTHIKKTKVSP